MQQHLKFSEILIEDKPRERLVNRGPEALSNIELLAIILRSGNKNDSVLNLSNKILNEFGSLKSLYNADFQQLIKIPGIGLAKACSIKAVCELALRFSLEKEKHPKVENPLQVVSFIKPFLYAKKKEHLYMISLDSKNCAIAKSLISIGTLTETLVHPREVFKAALLKNAVSIVLVHNHPSGDPLPSSMDISITRRVAKAGVMLGISLLDHVVFCDDDFLSMKAGNYLEIDRR